MSKTFRVISTSLVAVLLTLAAATQLGLAHDAKTKEKKIFAVHVVDLACYVGDGSIGDSHQECAATCAKTGIPLAIPDQKSGTLCLPLAKSHHGSANTELLPFVEKDIRVTGTVVEKDGMKTILLESAEPVK